MKHLIRINGQVKVIDCELGSCILDKNNKEIFEGDKVSAPPGMVSSAIGDTVAVGTVYFEAGTWIVAFPCAHDVVELYPIADDVEVVKHIEED